MLNMRPASAVTFVFICEKLRNLCSPQRGNKDYAEGGRLLRQSRTQANARAA
jgi:hypothetical protein